MTHDGEYFWEIFSSDDSYHSMQAWMRPRKAFCRRCGVQHPDWYPRAVEGCLEGIRSRPMYILATGDRKHSGYGIICSVRLWRHLAPHVPEAIVGRVFDRDKSRAETLNEAWVIPWFPEWLRVLVRASRPPGPPRAPTMPEVCTECGRPRYTAAWDPHLVRARLPPGRPVLATPHSGNFLIAESLAKTLDWSEFPDLTYERLPVLDRPLDGLRLEGDPPWD
ncbi:MAG: hypothetical protein KIT68_13255 [Phycisphaeraceae bacterium]|nr:hypothetical protein [Phycisphaeraceae bacterium]